MNNSISQGARTQMSTRILYELLFRDPYTPAYVDARDTCDAAFHLVITFTNILPHGHTKPLSIFDKRFS